MSTATETRKPANTVSQFCERSGFTFAQTLELMTLRDKLETAVKQDKADNARHWEGQASEIAEQMAQLLPGGWSLLETALSAELVDTSNTTRQIPRLECVLHYYRVDTDTVEGAQEWRDLRKLAPFRTHLAIGDTKQRQFEEWVSDLDGQTVILETAFLFGDQWNSAAWEGGSENGLRLYDAVIWQRPQTSGKFKWGYWLELSDDCQKARDTQHCCGYCGSRTYGQGDTFCSSCLDSPYLEEKDLPLLRLLPVSADRKRPDLSDDEKSELLPRFINAQTVAEGSRAVANAKKARADAIADCEKTIENATVERDGKLWLLDRHYPLENVIYYPSSREFCFGWRKPISRAEWDSKLSGLLMEFPFPWKIKGTDLPEETAGRLEK